MPAITSATQQWLDGSGYVVDTEATALAQTGALDCCDISAVEVGGPGLDDNGDPSPSPAWCGQPDVESNVVRTHVKWCRCCTQVVDHSSVCCTSLSVVLHRVRSPRRALGGRASWRQLLDGTWKAFETYWVHSMTLTVGSYFTSLWRGGRSG